MSGLPFITHMRTLAREARVFLQVERHPDNDCYRFIRTYPMTSPDFPGESFARDIPARVVLRGDAKAARACWAATGGWESWKYPYTDKR